MTKKLRKQLGISPLATAIVERQLTDLEGTVFDKNGQLKRLRHYRVDLERSAQQVLNHVAEVLKPS